MLTDADRELITAAVDGELTPAQDVAFRRLIAASAPAAALFAALMSDARHLRALPRAVVPMGMDRRVMERIRSTSVSTPLRVNRRHSFGRWPYAVAASLLLGIGTGTYWFAVRHPQGVEIASPSPIGPALHEETGPPRVHNPTPQTPYARESLPAPRDVVVTVAQHERPRTTEIVVRPPVESAPAPRLHGYGDVVASGPIADVRPFETVQVRLPFLVSVADLDQADTRARLLVELSDDPAYRLDLFTRDPHRAAEVFQAAARSAGVNLHVEGVAAERIRKRLPPIAWAVYSEALAPTDVVAFLDHLAKATRGDKVAPFGVAHLVPAQQSDHRELRELLGVDPGAWKRTPATLAPKPLSADTADRVASALASTARERSALLLSYLPPSARANPLASKEVKAYLDRRGPRLPTAVPLLIVIRPIG